MKIYEGEMLDARTHRGMQRALNRSKQRKQRSRKIQLRDLCSILFNSSRSCLLSFLAEFQIATIPCLMAKWVSSALVWICRDSII